MNLFHFFSQTQMGGGVPRPGEKAGTAARKGERGQAGGAAGGGGGPEDRPRQETGTPYFI